MPPVFELKISAESWDGPAAFSQKTSLKIPPVLEWDRDTYEFMGCILRCQSLRDNGVRYCARVAIDGRTYSCQEAATKGIPLNPVEPNLCHKDWVLEIPARSFLSTSGESGLMPLRLYYTRKVRQSPPLDEWVQQASSADYGADEMDLGRLDPRSSPIPYPRNTAAHREKNIRSRRDASRQNVSR